MLKEVNLNKVFVIDIETVPQCENFDQVPPHFRDLWEQKTRQARKDEFSAEEFYDRAGIWAEFGQVICISVGFFYNSNGKQHFRIGSHAGGDEKQVLGDFAQLLREQKADLLLCAHNGKEFDFPYLCRRMLINGIAIPPQLQLAGKRPWEVKHIDTLELWKFGDYKNYTSLDLLAAVLGIATPKDDMDGSMVKTVYYEEQNLPRIISYCQKDVITTAQILLRFKGLDAISEDCITLVSSC
ncbi:MAG: 3'-5' exonuclease [Pedobacter sp.]|nr:3'-5' exonuclease [Pedobacter sp.]MDQ8051534.1 3'-5' exonuclease [Pedobacter sp.]